MYINLTKIARYINSRSKGPIKIQVSLDADGEIKFSLGDVTYFTSYSKMMQVLEKNKKLYQDKKIPTRSNVMHAVLAKHVSNRIWASLGEKVYPEIA